MISLILRVLRLGRNHDVQGDIKYFETQRDQSLERARRTRAGGIEGALLPPPPPRKEAQRAN